MATWLLQELRAVPAAGGGGCWAAAGQLSAAAYRRQQGPGAAVFPGAEAGQRAAQRA